MPPHSSHLLQPLDVGCFSPLKASYGKQIENLVRVRINHITKLEFLSTFKEAFKAAFTEQNIKSGFRATGRFIVIFIVNIKLIENRLSSVRSRECPFPP
jgi:hypothetical protein